MINQAAIVRLTIIAVCYAVAPVTASGQSTPAPVYKACYAADKTGTIYRVNDPEFPAPGAFPLNTKTTTGCATSKDQSFTWNQTGPVGPQGPTGATGAAGPQGPIGPQGPAGLVGPDLSLTGSGTFGGAVTTQGNIVTNGGNVGASGSVTAGTDLISLRGNVVAGGGFMSASGSVTAGTDVISQRGNVVANGGNMGASGSVTAGTDLISQRGNVVAESGNLAVAGSATVGSLLTNGDATINGTTTVNNLVVRGSVTGVPASGTTSGAFQDYPDFQINPNETRTFTVQCPSGKKALSGGYRTREQATTDGTGLWVKRNGPTFNSVGWEVTITSRADVTYYVWVDTICAS